MTELDEALVLTVSITDCPFRLLVTMTLLQRVEVRVEQRVSVSEEPLVRLRDYPEARADHHLFHWVSRSVSLGLRTIET